MQKTWLHLQWHNDRIPSVSFSRGVKWLQLYPDPPTIYQHLSPEKSRLTGNKVSRTQEKCAVQLSSHGSLVTQTGQDWTDVITSYNSLNLYSLWELRNSSSPTALYMCTKNWWSSCPQGWQESEKQAYAYTEVSNLGGLSIATTDTDFQKQQPHPDPAEHTFELSAQEKACKHLMVHTRLDPALSPWRLTVPDFMWTLKTVCCDCEVLGGGCAPSHSTWSSASTLLNSWTTKIRIVYVKLV